MLTLFTSVYKENQPSKLLDSVFDIILEHGWSGFFSVFTFVMSVLEDFGSLASMEEIIRVWDRIFKSEYIFDFKSDLNFDGFGDRVDRTKLDKINMQHLRWALRHLKAGIGLVRCNEAVIDVFAEEFFAIHQKIKDIFVHEKIDFKNVIKEY